MVLVNSEVVDWGHHDFGFWSFLSIFSPNQPPCLTVMTNWFNGTKWSNAKWCSVCVPLDHGRWEVLQEEILSWLRLLAWERGLPIKVAYLSLICIYLLFDLFLMCGCQKQSVRNDNIRGEDGFNDKLCKMIDIKGDATNNKLWKISSRQRQTPGSTKRSNGRASKISLGNNIAHKSYFLLINYNYFISLKIKTYNLLINYW